MSKVLLVVGFGPGVSASVAERFGREGFSLALISRDEERHRSRVEALRSKGIQAASFQADAAAPQSMRSVIQEVRMQCGPISAVLWNAFGGEPRDLLTADPESIRSSFDIAVCRSSGNCARGAAGP